MSDTRQFGEDREQVGVTFDFPITAQRRFVFDGEPRDQHGELHLYVVEFGDYGVKVGYASHPTSRLMTHQRYGRNFGRIATRGWLSPAHVEAQANETALINFCADLTKTPRLPRREYSAAPFERVREYAASLPMTRLTPSDKEASQAKSLAGANVFASILLGRPADISKPFALVAPAPAESRPAHPGKPPVVCAEETKLTNDEVAGIIHSLADPDGTARQIYAVSVSAFCPMNPFHEGDCGGWVATVVETEDIYRTCWIRWDSDILTRRPTRTIEWLSDCSAKGVNGCLLFAGHPGECMPLTGDAAE